MGEEVMGGMLRRLGFIVVVAMVAGTALPAWCGTAPGSIAGEISGYVRDAGGVPQMGAAVEVLGSAAQALKVEFAVCRLTPPVKKVFDLSGMDKILSVYGELPC